MWKQKKKHFKSPFYHDDLRQDGQLISMIMHDCEAFLVTLCKNWFWKAVLIALLRLVHQLPLKTPYLDWLTLSSETSPRITCKFDSCPWGFLACLDYSFSYSLIFLISGVINLYAHILKFYWSPSKTTDNMC